MVATRSRILRVACVALALLTLSAAPRRSSRLPDIVLITVDSLRADALGVYGYPKGTSPNLDAFARESIVVTDAIAQAPFTKPSVASLMTGVFPGTHKTFTSSKRAESILKRNGTVKGSFDITDALPAELPTLAGSLRAAGYRTVGFSTNPYLIHDFGYDRGFTTFRFFGSGEAYTRAPAVLAEALEVLTAPHARPLFVWIHLMDVHNPYTPSERYRSMFKPATPPRPVPEQAIDPAVRIDGSSDANVYRARYDACIREVDHNLGAFLRTLRLGGDWKRTAVVVTADHGEEFYEHQRMGHNSDLFDEQVHVPLIIRLPGVAPRRLRMTAQLLDLYPTLIRLGGGQPPVNHGADLTAALVRGTAGDRLAFSELPGTLWAVRSTEWKLISSMPGTGHLYHLAGDAHEAQDVRAASVGQARRMDQALSAMISTEMRDGAKVGQRSVPIDTRVLEQLRALGYLSRQ